MGAVPGLIVAWVVQHDVAEGGVADHWVAGESGRRVWANECETENVAIRSIAAKLGITTLESLRK